MEKVHTPAAVSLSSVTGRLPSKAAVSGAFSDLLATARSSLASQESVAESKTPVILVGQITAEIPTVSELLKNHEELGESTWDIIYSRQNRDRNYTKIKPGTNIYYNRETAALSWTDPAPDSLGGAKMQKMHRLAYPDLSGHVSSEGSAPKTEAVISAGQQPLPSADTTVMQIGRIDSNNPTVSHLLINHQQLREHTWNLLANPVNKDKPFDRIVNGTEIYINVETMEITWSGAVPNTPESHDVPTAAQNAENRATALPLAKDRPAANLSDAVHQYLGTSYSEMNCYELIVKGLRHMDIPYAGKDGLFSKLTKMAVDSGLAPNAYLNGEGIIKAAGTLVLSRSYADVGNWQSEAAALVREIEPLLDKGQILSFSTEKRGHTGVISKKNEQWTFINSGRLDNSVNRSSINRGVGEEVLKEEIGNWLKTAQTEKETLTVTLGRLGQAKIQTAYTPTGSVSRQI